MRFTCRTVAPILLFAATCSAQSLTFNETAPQFESVVIGQVSKSKVFSIHNIGKSPALIAGIHVSSEYTESDQCPEWVPEGSGCLVFVSFAPISIGCRSGKLTVDLTNGEEASMALSGVGLELQENNRDTPEYIHSAKRTTNDEERAQSLMSDKRYSFQALLNNNPEDVACAKRVFALSGDTQSKERLASILVSIGISDETYFDYLEDEAKKALVHDHDMPWPLLYGKDKTAKSENPAFVEWCKKAGLPFWDIYRVSSYQIPSAWYYLAAAGDRRSYDLLIKGLRSPNLMIAAYAAEGLAKTGDARAIDYLIAAGREDTGEALGGIIQALIYFPDPKAQAAAEELTPPERKDLLDFYRRAKKEYGTRIMFQW